MEIRIAVCDDETVCNQLNLLRAVFPICNKSLFGQRDAFSAVRQFGIGFGKLVIVDEDEVSLQTID